ncbi:MAG: MerR family transcriptional regulator, partial [Clostridiales bacterium]|nr:MerR family transcriptional regulator [Clostridiales bacterium]
FMQWCTQGAATYKLRYELFVRQRAAVEEEISHLQRTLDMIRYKCWYYENAIADGNEERVKTLSEMPQEIRDAYEGAHRP